jgi:acyl transferase domain-containing protein/short-subunit dehydrogenase/acyl carrier protein
MADSATTFSSTSKKPLNTTDNHIAIIGMACRFPGGASSIEQYWQLLKDGIDATSTVPTDRWDLKRFYHADRSMPGKSYVKRGGFLTDAIDKFDASFFGISPREATPLDPQQRLLLEVSWEALEEAGIVPEKIEGSATGVYIGGFTMDNKIHLLNVHNRETITTHTAISSTAGMLANRLSYTYDLRGPSLTVDTACSSSLVALHLACKDLLSGDCEMAITGGVNIMLRPEYTIAMCKGGFLAADGRCKTFDASGDGYGRGEGAGILLLKRYQKAVEDGDKIHAIIAGSGMNQDGRSDGITAPSMQSQADLLQKVYQQSGITADQVQYIEAHGTGTKAGDLAETTSLGEMIGMRRSTKEYLWTGSAKSNIGHLEAAAGVAGIIKATMALKHKKIPPNLHFNTPRSDIDFDRLRLKVPVKLTDWPDHHGPAGVGVNAFGYGGTNAHVVLQEAPKQVKKVTKTQDRPMILPITAASKTSLLNRIRQISVLIDAKPDLQLEDLGYTLAKCQSHHAHRLVLVAAQVDEVRKAVAPFNQLASDHQDAPNQPTQVIGKPKLAFVYTGMGPQYWGMGVHLIEQSLCARQILEQCDVIWQPLANWSLMTLFSQRTTSPMDEPQFAQPGNFIVQLMLTEIAHSYGVTAAGVVGHSVGEIAAACVSGSLSLKDALTLVYHRSQQQQRVSGMGKMLAIGLSLTELKPYLRGFETQISVAAINSQNSTTVAGAADVLEQLMSALENDQHFYKLLRVNVAYHSHQMEPLADDFHTALNTLEPQIPSQPLFSSVTGQQVIAAEQDCSYWWKNTRQPVYFAAVIETMIGQGYNTFIEIGPHPVLSSAIKDGLRHAGIEGESFASVSRQADTVRDFINTLARLCGHGIKIDWQQHYEQGNRLTIGAYPWDKQLLWQETVMSRLDRLGSIGHPLLSKVEDSPIDCWQGELNLELHHYLTDHTINNEVIFPAAGYIEMALASQKQLNGSIVLENFKFIQTLAVAETPVVQLVKSADDSNFALYSKVLTGSSKWAKNASGRSVGLTVSPQNNLDYALVKARCNKTLERAKVYDAFAEAGLTYGAAFRTIQQINIGGNEILTQLEVSELLLTDIEDYHIQPTLLDGAFQSLLVLHMQKSDNWGGAFVPVSIKELRFHRKPEVSAWCHAKLSQSKIDSAACVTGDLIIYDHDGQVCMEIFGLQAKAIVTDNPLKKHLSRFKFDWSMQSLPTVQTTQRQRWLVFSDNRKVGKQLLLDAVQKDITCIVVHAGTEFRQHTDCSFEVARGSRQDMAQLFAAIDANNITAVVYLWGLDIVANPEIELQRNASGIIDVNDLTAIMQSMGLLQPVQAQTLCIALNRAQSVTDSKEINAPGQHALIGLGRVFAVEYPAAKLKMVDLNSLHPSIGSEHLINELLSMNRESEVAIRNNTRFVNRLVHCDQENKNDIAPPDFSFELLKDEPKFIEVKRKRVNTGEVEIVVHSCSVTSKGHANDNRGQWQSLCVGSIVSLGQGISEYELGQMVAVITPARTIQSYVTISVHQIVRVPTGMSSQQATILADWITAYYAIFYVGKLKSGDHILIHQAGNDTQLTAAILAKWCGAKVYATQWGTGKQDELLALGLEKIYDSTSLDFSDDLKRLNTPLKMIMSATPELLPHSFELLEEDGLVLCQNSGAGELRLSANVSKLRMQSIDIDAVSLNNPQMIRDIVAELDTIFKQNKMPVVPITRYPAQKMALVKDKLISDDFFGKLVIDVYQQPVLLSQRFAVCIAQPNASYIVTGGFSGLGLVTLQWLADNQANEIIVFSRSGPTTELARETITSLKTQGVNVISFKVDISDRNSVQTAVNALKLNCKPIKGVIHSGAVVDDAHLADLSTQQIERVMQAKALGAWNLHHVLMDCPLDFFVCYSSITSMLGNSGQGNYAAANAFVDGLVQYRRSRGYCGLTINWGPIKDVGMVARDERIARHLETLGLFGIEADKGLEMVAKAINENTDQLGLFEIDWVRWTQHSATVNNLLEKVLTNRVMSNDKPAKFRLMLSQLDVALRLCETYTYVQNTVSKVLRLPSSRIGKKDSLVDLGVDSLMSIELSEMIRQETGVRFRPLFMSRGPTIEELASLILDDVFADNRIEQVAVC